MNIFIFVKNLFYKEKDIFDISILSYNKSPFSYKLIFHISSYFFELHFFQSEIWKSVRFMEGEREYTTWGIMEFVL